MIIQVLCKTEVVSGSYFSPLAWEPNKPPARDILAEANLGINLVAPTDKRLLFELDET